MEDSCVGWCRGGGGSNHGGRWGGEWGPEELVEQLVAPFDRNDLNEEVENGLNSGVEAILWSFVTF